MKRTQMEAEINEAKGIITQLAQSTLKNDKRGRTAICPTCNYEAISACKRSKLENISKEDEELEKAVPKEEEKTLF